MINKIKQNWYWYIIIGFIVFAMGVFTLCGERSVIAVHDNLDLFIPQYEMMKASHNFFGKAGFVGFLAGQDRNYLPSEFNLVTVLYMILPPFAAYVGSYLLKIVIAIIGAVLFAKEVFGERYDEYKPIVLMAGFAYGILNLFPNFGIAFAAIPLLLFIMKKIVDQPKWYWFIILFLYPFLSYFSYIGAFLIGYVFIYFIYRWIRYKKFPLRIILAVLVLTAGFVAMEYRLFNVMLFYGVETIRETMVRVPMSPSEIFKEIITGFYKGDMHTESVHMYFVMPVCLVFFCVQTVIYIKNKEFKKIFTDYYNGILLFIIGNSIIFGIMNYVPFRNLLETIMPPLKGFDFGRTEFTNPFLWYLAFFFVLKRIYDYIPKYKWIANVMAVVAVLVIICAGTRYNDLNRTVFSVVYELKNGVKTNDLTYEEFYSEDLFEQAKEDIQYSGQWSVAYGFYPAVLEYNGINTLDGYLGYYEQYYKEAFRKIIAPALDRIPESKAYYDNWGARCNLYSGTEPSVVNAYRAYGYTDEDIYIDLDAFKNEGGRYIFSRVILNNAEEVGLTLIGTYTDENSPYTLYLYQTASRYVNKDRAEVMYEDRANLTYDLEEGYALIEEINEIVNGTYTENGKTRLYELLNEAQTFVDLVGDCYSIADINYKKDISSEQWLDREEEIYADYVEYIDDYFVALSSVANSDYIIVISDIYNSVIAEEMKDYEEMTEEEIARDKKLASLSQEYFSVAAEEFYFDYNGEEWSFERLNEEEDNLEMTDWMNIFQGLYKVKADAVGELYKEIINLNIEKYESDEDLTDSYENVVDYRYQSGFARDYTTKDAKQFFKEIKKETRSYMTALQMAENLGEYYPGWISDDDTATYNAILPYMSTIDPELSNALEYMLEYNLYDLASDENKADQGFTTGMDYYGDAYIFDSPYRSPDDVLTYVHEYGHYNNIFHMQNRILDPNSCIDMSEVHSQGLELLFSDNYADIYGEETGKYLKGRTISRMMEAIIEASIVAEFEIYAFEHPDASVYELSKKYADLYKEYGYNLSFDVMYTWVDIPHIFNQPLYYISYATSAIAALNIYVESLDDYNYACEKYMELTALPTGSGFRNALTFVGLPDVFDKGVTRDILKTTSDVIISLCE